MPSASGRLIVIIPFAGRLLEDSLIQSTNRMSDGSLDAISFDAGSYCQNQFVISSSDAAIFTVEKLGESLIAPIAAFTLNPTFITGCISENMTEDQLSKTAETLSLPALNGDADLGHNESVVSVSMTIVMSSRCTTMCMLSYFLHGIDDCDTSTMCIIDCLLGSSGWPPPAMGWHAIFNMLLQFLKFLKYSWNVTLILNTTLHHQVLAEMDFGKVTCAGSVLVLRKIAVFSLFPSIHDSVSNNDHMEAELLSLTLAVLSGIMKDKCLVFPLASCTTDSQVCAQPGFFNVIILHVMHAGRARVSGLNGLEGNGRPCPISANFRESARSTLEEA